MFRLFVGYREYAVVKTVRVGLGGKSIIDFTYTLLLQVTLVHAQYV